MGIEEDKPNRKHKKKGDNDPSNAETITNSNIINSTNNCILTCKNCNGPPMIYTIEDKQIIMQNCKECIDGYNLLFETNDCYNSSIKEYGFYLSSNDSMYHECDIQCKTCEENFESEEPNCLLCNDEEGYFPAENKPSSLCYNESTIRENYYLDESSNKKWVLYYSTSNGTHVRICPDNTYSFSFNHTCLDTCPQNYEKDEENKKCIVKTIDTLTSINEFKYQIMNNITEFANSSKIINGSDFIAVISYSDNMNTEEQIKNGKSVVDLGNCTQTIKNHYNISDDEKLIIVNMEQKYNKTRENKNDENSSVDLGKDMQVEVYDISGNQLDLSVCKEELKILKYIGDVEELNIDLAKDLSGQGIDVFDRNDKFFNDICLQLKNRSQDIILKDRVADIYQNVDICQKGCIYTGMNYTLMMANCICESSLLQIDIDNKTNIDNTNDVEENVNLNLIKTILKTSIKQINFNVIPCSNLVFDKKILANNIGFFCMGTMFILQLIFLFVYAIKKLQPIKYFMLIFSHKSYKSKYYAIPHQKKVNYKNNSTIKKNFKSKIQFLQNENKTTKNFENDNINKKKISNTNFDFSNLKINKENNKYKNDKIILTNNFIASLNQNEIKNENINEIKLDKYKIEVIKTKTYTKKKKIKNLKKNNTEIKNKFIETNGNINNKNNNEINFLSKTDENLQELEYEESLIYDKRTLLRMYFSFLQDSQIILYTFFSKNYLDLFVIKLSFLIVTFQISFFLNALFYTEDYISEAYHNNGVLNFISSLPKSIYSFLFTMIITNLLKTLSNSKSELMRIIIEKRNGQNYINLINIKLIKLRIKLIVYFILIVSLGIFFLYYVTAFCAVYYNSQKYWIIGCIESFALDSLTAHIICIFLAAFRFISIKKRIKYLYSFANIISAFL